MRRRRRRAKACSATCCRWSKAPPSAPSTARCKTDHILFIASGAFHLAKPSDLIPELQGRFPIRVELSALGKDDFVRILTEPKAALTRSTRRCCRPKASSSTFTADAVDRLAEIAAQVNERQENIGARRLHTVLERLLDTLSYEAPDRDGAGGRASTAPTSTRTWANWCRIRTCGVTSSDR